MRPLWHITRLMWRAGPWAMWRGAAAALAVLVMGTALLGLSGWFITAAGAAGIAGVGIAFDVFRPSAGVRFLALGRAGARYAERLLTHDTTLRALASLRLAVLEQLEQRPIASLRQLRSGAGLNRIIADVDALDGLLLRLVLPVIAGLLTHLGALALIWWLAGAQIALSLSVGYLVGSGLVLWRAAKSAVAPSVEAETARQTLRHDVIGLLRGRRDVIVQGLLPKTRIEIDAAEAQATSAERHLSRIDERTALRLSLVVTLCTAAALALGQLAVRAGTIDAATAAIGVFVALALAETVLPLRRGLADLGRMHSAARRLLRDGTTGHPTALSPITPDTSRGLTVTDLTVARPGRQVAVSAPLSLTLHPGDVVALAGPSGHGKSTLLDALAGLTNPLSGQVTLAGIPLSDWPETQLRDCLTLVPQRTSLIGGTVRENLALSVDTLTDGAAWAALQTVCMTDVIARVGGLDGVLGEAGSGLSGGEARRLALARAVLRAPKVLLLDEPTEGLDDALARDVLAGLKKALPECAILMAAHRPAETEFATRTISVKRHITKTEYI
ncbi:ATP-binding cassette domain-containing protein [Rhodobacteraceae bacterium SC52]|nr:ATP-binding cassette domain-containing protein [Rhodobacteraceae bacterium SC52]